VKDKIRAFQRFIAEQYQEEGFFLHSDGVDESDNPAYSITSATAHVCGEPAVTFESNQGLDYLDEKNPWLVKYTYDEIYRHHIMTLEGLCTFLLK